MRVVIADIIKELDSSVLSRKEDIDLSDFKRINAQDYGKSIAFIDGGNAELLKSPNFSLHFIRTYAVIFQNNKKIDSIKNEFFSLTYAINKNKDIIYETKLFQFKGSIPNENDLNFNIFDKTIKSGKEKANISIIGCIARRFAELQLAEKVNADIVVIDGNLKPIYTNEDKYIDRILENNSVICALAKTSDIITSKGNCYVSQLNSMNIDYEWYYKTKKRIFVKLNKSSKYVFSMQINSEEDIEVAVNQIAYNSNDAVFSGYPYGLILADRFARISNNEKEHLCLLFKTLAGEQWDKIRHCINATNAHDILDNIN